MDTQQKRIEQDRKASKIVISVFFQGPQLTVSKMIKSKKLKKQYYILNSYSLYFAVISYLPPFAVIYFFTIGYATFSWRFGVKINEKNMFYSKLVSHPYFNYNFHRKHSQKKLELKKQTIGKFQKQRSENYEHGHKRLDK